LTLPPQVREALHVPIEANFFNADNGNGQSLLRICLYMYLFICIYIYVHIYIHVCRYIYIYKCIYIYTYIHILTYIYVPIEANFFNADKGNDLHLMTSCEFG